MTIKNYAVINSTTNICENVILWDGRTEPIVITEPEIIVDENGNVVETGNTVVVETIQPWQPPANCYVIDIDGLDVGIGWQYESNAWTDVRNIVAESKAE